jgi:hypothetical protein
MRFALVTSVAAMLLLSSSARTPAQPTYKLDVKPNLKPLATLKLEGSKITRTPLKDDPGFRLQYHFKKDGKTLAMLEARTDVSLEVPQKEAGTYTVVLELFYPNYKGGTAQKGEFKGVSNVLTYKVEAPGKVMLVETPMPPPPPPAKK